MRLFYRRIVYAVREGPSPKNEAILVVRPVFLTPRAAFERGAGTSRSVPAAPLKASRSATVSVSFLGVATGAFRIAETLLDSTLQMLRNVPNLAIIPMVILWFGIGEEAKIFLVSVGVLFPVYLNTFHGIRTVDQGLVEMARIYGVGPAALFCRVIFPSALPSILVGLRYALGIMWLSSSTRCSASLPMC